MPVDRTADCYPIYHAHLHRHTFEITHVAGTPSAGVHKDVAMIGGYPIMDIDLVDKPGLSLFQTAVARSR